MNKNEIRKSYGDKRKKLSDHAANELTDQMLQQFATISLTNIKAALSYSPMEHHKEFNAGRCETILRERQPGVRIAHPRIIQDNNFMEAVVVNEQTRYSGNDWNLREPSHGEIVTPESIDLVLVPLLAFDHRGFRVGYGKGFYDRWLAQCRPGVYKIGFSFFEPVDSIDDINEFDVPLNLCVTPMRVYEF